MPRLSSLLYYGPGARDKAIEEALSRGRLLCPPIGDQGLKVDDARAVAELLQGSAVGDALGAVVIGPMDWASKEAPDVLLKSIEDTSEWVYPVLWAFDIGEVRDTIISRCLAHWAPAEDGKWDLNQRSERVANTLLESIKDNDTMTVLTIVRDLMKKDAKDKEREEDHDIGVELLVSLVQRLDPERTEDLELWLRIRRAMRVSHPSPAEILDALLPAVK